MSDDERVDVIKENTYFTPLELYLMLSSDVVKVAFEDGLGNKMVYNISKLPSSELKLTKY